MNNTADALVAEVVELVGPTAYEEVTTEDYVVLMTSLFGPRTAAQLAAGIRETRVRMVLERMPEGSTR